MIKSFPLNSPLLEIKTPALAFNCSYASSVIDKIQNPLTFADSAYKYCRFHLHLRIPLTFCGIHLQLQNSKQLATFACCGIRGTTNVPTKFTLQVIVRGIHGSFVSGLTFWNMIHWHFGTCLKVCLWNRGTRRHKIIRLSSAKFGLVMEPLFAVSLNIEVIWNSSSDRKGKFMDAVACLYQNHKSPSEKPTQMSNFASKSAKVQGLSFRSSTLAYCSRKPSKILCNDRDDVLPHANRQDMLSLPNDLGPTWSQLLSQFRVAIAVLEVLRCPSTVEEKSHVFFL